MQAVPRIGEGIIVFVTSLRFHIATHHKVKIRINLVKEELTEDVGTRTDVALQLVACAVSFKIRQCKECYGRKTKVVWIDVD